MGSQRTRDAEAELNLPPGFRFHPTDEELVVHYLCRKIAHQSPPVPIIAEIDLYKYNPWELPEKALFGQREWYYFTPRDRKYPNGSRPNRAAGRGYWKATGADKPVSPRGSGGPLGIKKALVFYSGKAPKGVKTDWIMHEYRLADASRGAGKKGTLRLDEWVLCRLYNKKNSWEKLQQQKAEAAAAASFEETTVDEDSFRTSESDIDDDVFPDFDDLGRSTAYPSAAAGAGQPVRNGGVDSGFQMVEQQPKEESEWFTDLNLDDLQSPLMAFGSTPVLDDSNQDFYFQAFGSPQLRPSLTSMPPF